MFVIMVMMVFMVMMVLMVMMFVVMMFVVMMFVIMMFVIMMFVIMMVSVVMMVFMIMMVSVVMMVFMIMNRCITDFLRIHGSFLLTVHQHTYGRTCDAAFFSENKLIGYIRDPQLIQPVDHFPGIGK